MLQNSRVTAFTAFELLRENQLGGGGGGILAPPPPPPPNEPPPTQIRVNFDSYVPKGIGLHAVRVTQILKNRKNLDVNTRSWSIHLSRIYFP